MKVNRKGVKGHCSFGLVMQVTVGSDFKGVWWDILFDSISQSIHISVITPLRDKEGECLK